jgi:iron complex outermembrane receptor protein
VQQAGMRADYQPSATDTITLQSDYYDGREGTPDGSFFNGANVVARWTRVHSPQNEWQVQFYWDHNDRNVPSPRQSDQVTAFDVDVQHRFPLGTRHDVLWGFGYRYTHDALTSDSVLSFVPATRNLKLASAFLQDEISPIPDKLRVIVGAKVEHDELLGFEVQPSVRMAWTPQPRRMAWTAVSRAVRSPSRFDRDLVSPGTVGGGEAFASENVIAWEAGYRMDPLDRVSLSLAAFHNRYDHVRSFNRVAPRPAPLVLANDRDATSSGVELSARYQAAPWWRLRGGATWMTTTFRDTSAAVVPGSSAFEARDPRSQLLVQSMMDLPGHLQLDLVGRHVHDIPASVLGPSVPRYATFDARMAWRMSQWELSVVGQNLGAAEHSEFDSPALQHEIPRSVYGKLAFTW